jgi:hypothetical protein
LPGRYEKLLIVSLVSVFLLFFFLCSCEKENLIDPPDFVDAANPTMWRVCTDCGLFTPPGPQYAPPPGESDNICTGANPTSGPLCIQYTLATANDVSLSIYSAKAELIADLLRESKLPGTYSLYWDLTDSKGGEVPNGAYRAYFKVGGDVSYGDIIVER